jgi:uncharacterized membrane protein YfcA
MGLVVSGVWLHIITPIETATLIAGYGLMTQGYGIWQLRRALRWKNIWPMTLGSAIGIPIGVLLLTCIDPAHLRFAVGVLLVIYTIYGLARPALKPIQIGIPADVVIGLCNGVLGGLTGLGGVITTISCQWRGWPKDMQRAVFQPVLFAAFVVISASLAAAGAVTGHTLQLYVLGAPFLLAGLWVGFRMYGKVDDELFRKSVLVLLLFSGISLIVSVAIMRAPTT